jgi:hypothetical protein
MVNEQRMTSSSQGVVRVVSVSPLYFPKNLPKMSCDAASCDKLAGTTNESQPVF